jgi:hypothetical protein
MGMMVARIFCQQADAGLKWGHAAVDGVVDFPSGKIRTE